MFGQPTAEIGYQTDLPLPRLLSVALATHLGCIGIDIRSQGAALLAQLMCFENLLHECSPSSPDCQENAAGLCRENSRQTTVRRPEGQLTRNSPEPGIVSELMAGYALRACRSFGGTTQCVRKTVI